MLSHIIFGTQDLDRQAELYDSVLPHRGLIRRKTEDSSAGAALSRVALALHLPRGHCRFFSHPWGVDTVIPIPYAAGQVQCFTLMRNPAKLLFLHFLDWLSFLIRPGTAVLIVQIFAVNIGMMGDHFANLGIVFVAISLSFIVTFLRVRVWLGCSAHYSQYTLLAITFVAQNALLMLTVMAMAMAILDQPLSLAGIIIVMLVELFNMTKLKQVLLARHHRKGVFS